MKPYLIIVGVITMLISSAAMSADAPFKKVITSGNKPLIQTPLPVAEDMKLKRDEKTANLIIPAWCAAWFDGCNDCHFAAHKGAMIGSCTSRICPEDKNAQAYCTKRKPEIKK